jgi:hypothetical protein
VTDSKPFHRELEFLDSLERLLQTPQGVKAARSLIAERLHALRERPTATVHRLPEGETETLVIRSAHDPGYDTVWAIIGGIALDGPPGAEITVRYRGSGADLHVRPLPR